MDLLFIIPAFLVTIGILVTVHEYGHYWVAKKLGVKVLRFSVGMGKSIWSKRSGADNTEYCIAALPLGGYVKMLDEREGDVDPAEAHRAFNRQSVWTRIAIVIAGPLANFILAIFVYCLMYLIGVQAIKPFVYAQPNTPAAIAGFQAGDQITAINGKTVLSMQDARMLVLEEYLKDPTLRIDVTTQQGGHTARTLDLSNEKLLKDEQDLLDQIGLYAWAREKHIVVSKVLPDSPAEQAGLKAKDQLVKANGEVIENARSLIKIIQASADKPLNLEVQRSEGVAQIQVTPKLIERDGKQVAQVGMGLGEVVPEAVMKELIFTHSYSPVDAFVRGLEETYQMSVMSLKLMGRLVTGDVSLSNISGPVTIATYAGSAARSGLPYFLGFLAIISISLGILNLLPIPMLDGGHLMYYLIEIVKGSPVSEKIEELGLRIGMAAVGSLMVIALYNDFMRLIK